VSDSGTGSAGTVEELGTRECWDYLQAHDFGRIGVAPGGEVAIYPINYLAEQGRIYLRTSPGAKLVGLMLNTRVAFEIDGRSDDSAWSVLVIGTAEEVEMPPKIEPPETQERPWVPGPRNAVVEITPSRITGRRFTRAADTGSEPEAAE
jgi:nitroimidazol reductase NimA-like FMN-containing flavoprotein (pyridoxamine 5'-phosphate oxidase superfamily)